MNLLDSLLRCFTAEKPKEIHFKVSEAGLAGAMEAPSLNDVVLDIIANLPITDTREDFEAKVAAELAVRGLTVVSINVTQRPLSDLE